MNNEYLYRKLEDILALAQEALSISYYVSSDLEYFERATGYIRSEQAERCFYIHNVAYDKMEKLQKTTMNLLCELDKSEREVENVSSPKSVCAPADQRLHNKCRSARTIRNQTSTVCYPKHQETI